MIKSLDSFRLKINQFLIRVIKAISALGLTAESRQYWLRHKREKSWLHDGGESFKKTDFNFLSQASVVLDIGGYTGEFIAPLLCKYGSRIYTYEPVPEFAEKLRDRFLSNNSVNVINAAVGAKSGTIKLNLGHGGTSLFKTAENENSGVITAKMLGIAGIVKELNEIDLLSINCEGGEYEILEALTEGGLANKIACYFIQFHDVAGDSDTRRNKILRDLSHTHKLVYDYPWVWTRLDRINSSNG